MPSVSKSQLAYFQKLKDNPELAKKAGISKETIEEFTKEPLHDLPNRKGKKTIRSKKRKYI